MARTGPVVQAGLLRIPSAPSDRPIAVGSPEWYAWLAGAEAFTYESARGRFGARRERFQRGGWYWKAYRRVSGRLRRAYLGKPEDLSAERLERIAAWLAEERDGPPDGAGADRAQAGNAALRSPALLETKLLLPPLRHARIPREQLTGRLLAALASPLTVVIAPAGFGKTTLLAEALGARPQAASPRSQAPRVAWLSLDAADDDLQRFWTYAIAALQRCAPEVAPIGAMFQAPTPPPTEWVLTNLINALAGAARSSPAPPPELILVLDDYHAITDPAIHASLAFLIDRLPPRLRLVIASRTEPPLPLARWRASGRVGELRAPDLRLSEAESRELLEATIGQPLAPEQVGMLVARTEGWAAGLHLAGLALRASVSATAPGAPHAELMGQITGSHPYILDYLVDEIVRRQPAHIQEFLLRTSILDRMCGPLCDAVLGLAAAGDRGGEAATSPSQPILEQIERANLFLIPLDGERRWYRYHQLFADALRAQLGRTQPALVAELHRRAMLWYEQQAAGCDIALLSDALDHALAAGEPHEAARLVERSVPVVLWKRGDVHTLLRWRAKLPVEAIRANPRLGIALAWALLITVRLGELDRCLEMIERAVEAAGAEPGLLAPSERASLAGQICAIRSYAVRINGDVQGSLELGRRALELLPAEERTARGLALLSLQNCYCYVGNIPEARRLIDALLAEQEGRALLSVLSTAGLRSMQAYLLHQSGQLREAEELLMLGLREVSQLPDDQLKPTAMLYNSLCELYYDTNDLDLAEHYGRQALELGEHWWNYDVLCNACFVLGRVLRARGDQAGAEALFRRGNELGLAYNVRSIERDVRLVEAWQAFESGDWELAERELADHEVRLDEPLEPTRYGEYELLARLLIVKGRPADAQPLIERLLALAEEGGHTLRIIGAHKLMALALHAAGRADEALEQLSRALARAEPAGVIRTFVDEGEPMRELLSCAQQRGVAGEYVRKLLAAFAGQHSSGAPREQRAPGPGQTAQPSPAPLTPRELEVLRLAAAGASNQAIAERLVVSVNTVKKHLSSVLAKLGAASRTQAAALAREQGLL